MALCLICTLSCGPCPRPGSTRVLLRLHPIPHHPDPCPATRHPGEQRDDGKFPEALGGGRYTCSPKGHHPVDSIFFSQGSILCVFRKNKRKTVRRLVSCLEPLAAHGSFLPSPPAIIKLAIRSISACSAPVSEQYFSPQLNEVDK